MVKSCSAIKIIISDVSKWKIDEQSRTQKVPKGPKLSYVFQFFNQNQAGNMYVDDITKFLALMMSRWTMKAFTLGFKMFVMGGLFMK